MDDNGNLAREVRGRGGRCLDGSDAVEVEILLAKALHGIVLQHGGRADRGVVDELGGAEEEGKTVVVVEAPHAVGASGLEEVGRLERAHDAHVPVEDVENHGWAVLWNQDAEFREAQKPADEGSLVPCACVAQRIEQRCNEATHNRKQMRKSKDKPAAVVESDRRVKNMQGDEGIGRGQEGGGTCRTGWIGLTTQRLKHEGRGGKETELRCTSKAARCEYGDNSL